MPDELKELIRLAETKANSQNLWDYSLRAKEYAEWLEQIYNELYTLRDRKDRE